MALNKPLDSRLSTESLKKLDSILGETIISISGLDMPSWLLSPVVNLETASKAIQISGVVEESDFDQEFDTYATFRISSGSADEIREAKEAGTVYYQTAGKQIRQIHVIREAVSQTSQGEHQWTYVADVALVLSLDHGSLVFRLSTLHNELIKVELLDNFSLDTFTRPITSFEDDVFTSHNYETFMLSLDECLSDAKRGPLGREK